MQRTSRLASTVLALLVLAASGAGPASAQTSPAQPNPSAASDMPMDDYLALLARIAPAAHDGASAYRQAWQQRCGRLLTTAELRVAMAVGDGDPVLMGMIRASHVRDSASLASLAARVDCKGVAR